MPTTSTKIAPPPIRTNNPPPRPSSPSSIFARVSSIASALDQSSSQFSLLSGPSSASSTSSASHHTYEHSHSRSTSSSSTKSNSKAILRTALARAHDAVVCDGNNDVQGAIDAYTEAVTLLVKVLGSVEREEDRKKMKEIHDTYTERIRLLNNISPTKSSSDDSFDETTAPTTRTAVIDSYPSSPHSPHIVSEISDDSDTDIVPAFTKHSVSHERRRPSDDEVLDPYLPRSFAVSSGPGEKSMPNSSRRKKAKPSPTPSPLPLGLPLTASVSTPLFPSPTSRSNNKTPPPPAPKSPTPSTASSQSSQKRSPHGRQRSPAEIEQSNADPVLAWLNAPANRKQVKDAPALAKQTGTTTQSLLSGSPTSGSMPIPPVPIPLQPIAKVQTPAAEFAQQQRSQLHQREEILGGGGGGKSIKRTASTPQLKIAPTAPQHLAEYMHKPLPSPLASGTFIGVTERSSSPGPRSRPTSPSPGPRSRPTSPSLGPKSRPTSPSPRSPMTTTSSASSSRSNTLLSATTLGSALHHVPRSSSPTPPPGSSSSKSTRNITFLPEQKEPPRSPTPGLPGMPPLPALPMLGPPMGNKTTKSFMVAIPPPPKAKPPPAPITVPPPTGAPPPSRVPPRAEELRDIPPRPDSAMDKEKNRERIAASSPRPPPMSPLPIPPGIEMAGMMRTEKMEVVETDGAKTQEGRRQKEKKVRAEGKEKEKTEGTGDGGRKVYIDGDNEISDDEAVSVVDSEEGGEEEDEEDEDDEEEDEDEDEDEDEEDDEEEEEESISRAVVKTFVYGDGSLNSSTASLTTLGLASAARKLSTGSVSSVTTATAAANVAAQQEKKAVAASLPVPRSTATATTVGSPLRMHSTSARLDPPLRKDSLSTLDITPGRSASPVSLSPRPSSDRTNERFQSSTNSIHYPDPVRSHSASSSISFSTTPSAFANLMGGSTPAPQPLSDSPALTSPVVGTPPLQKVGPVLPPPRRASRMARPDHPTLPPLSTLPPSNVIMRANTTGPGTPTSLPSLSTPPTLSDKNTRHRSSSLTIGGSPHLPLPANALGGSGIVVGTPNPTAQSFSTSPNLHAGPRDRSNYFSGLSHSAPHSRTPSAINPLPLPDPPPTDSTQRAFWLMRQLATSMVSGGYLTKRLYIPKGLWVQLNVRLPLVEHKIAACEQLAGVLARCERLEDLTDMQGIVKLVGEVENALEIVQGSLGKKLGLSKKDVVALVAGLGLAAANGSGDGIEADGVSLRGERMSGGGTSVGGPVVVGGSSSGRKPQPSFIAWGSKFTKSVERMNFNSNNKSEDHPQLYVEALVRVLQAAQVLDTWLRHFSTSSPTPSSFGTTAGPSDRERIATRVSRAGETISVLVCGFVVRDLAILLGKWVKRGGGWVGE